MPTAMLVRQTLNKESHIWAIPVTYLRNRTKHWPREYLSPSSLFSVPTVCWGLGSSEWCPFHSYWSSCGRNAWWNPCHRGSWGGQYRGDCTCWNCALCLKCMQLNSLSRLKMFQITPFCRPLVEKPLTTSRSYQWHLPSRFLDDKWIARRPKIGCNILMQWSISLARSTTILSNGKNSSGLLNLLSYLVSTAQALYLLGRLQPKLNQVNSNQKKAWL